MRKLAPITSIINEIGQILNALAHPVNLNGRIEPARLFDRLDHERSLQLLSVR